MSTAIQVFPNKLKGAKAALLFLDGQYAYQEMTEQGETFKFLSPTAVRTAFMNEPIDSGWLPQATVRHGFSARGIWTMNFYPSRDYNIRIREGEKTHSIELNLPSALFAGTGDSYYILAAKENTFDPYMPLFAYPLPNVNHAGLICFGSNKHGEATPAETDHLFGLFMGTIFNNHHVDKKSLREEYKTNIIPLLLKLAEKRSSYPHDDLIPYANTTPERVLHHFTKSHS
jgi:hypothetical protein